MSAAANVIGRKLPVVLMATLGLIFVSSCSSVDYIGYGKGTYSETDHIEVFRSPALPEKPYEAIGELRMRGNAFHSITDMIELGIEEAKEVGGDAVIISDEGERQRGDYMKPYATVIVIRWKDR